MNETTSTSARAESKKGIYFRFKNKTYYSFAIYMLTNFVEMLTLHF